MADQRRAHTSPSPSRTRMRWSLVLVCVLVLVAVSEGKKKKPGKGKKPGKKPGKKAFKARGQGRMRRWLPKADRRKHQEVHGQRKMRLLVGHHQERLCLLQEGSRRHAVRVPNAQVLLQEV